MEKADVDTRKMHAELIKYYREQLAWAAEREKTVSKTPNPNPGLEPLLIKARENVENNKAAYARIENNSLTKGWLKE